MTKIMILTHGLLADGLVSSVELILGSAVHVSTLSLNHGDDVDAYKQSVESCILEAEEEHILVFTDLFGGTPNNTIAKIMHENKMNRKIKCYVGVNLPMLLEAISMKDVLAFDDLVQHIDENCKGSIFDISTKLSL